MNVVTISSLEYQAIDSALDTNPNAGGGSRIYPEKQTPSDSINRKRVRVRATLSGAVADIKIYFKSLDLDDPSANASPVDPNGSSGGDNRGNIPNGILSAVNTNGTTNTVTITTNSSGIADADFLVTTHPGDNFMVGASGDPTITSGLVVRPDGTALEDAGGADLPITKAKQTTMLTVWRKIHLEVDNMGGVSGNSGFNIVSGGFSGTGGTILETYYNLPTGQFENGRLTLLGDTHDVLTNQPGYTVITTEIDPVWPLIEQEFTIVDDDDYDNDNNPNNGDAGETIVNSLNAFSKMQNSDSATLNVFAPAYIKPVYDGGGSSVAFDLNLETADISGQVTPNYNSWGNGSNDFWVAYMQVGYQGSAAKDHDPSAEISVDLGIAGANTSQDIGLGCSSVPQGGLYSFVFQETIRDVFVTLSQSIDNLTAPHELGHQLGLAERTSDSTLMGDGVGNSNLHANDIHTLRCRVKSPGRS